MRKRQNCLKTAFIPGSVSECIIHFNQGYFRPLILVKDMSDYIPHEYFFSQLGQKRDIQDGGDGHIEVSDHYEYKDFCCTCKCNT